jgi:hypothetical protein
MQNKFNKAKKLSIYSNYQAKQKLKKSQSKSRLRKNNSAVFLTPFKTHKKLIDVRTKERNKSQSRFLGVCRPIIKRSKSQNLRPNKIQRQPLCSPSFGFSKSRSPFEKGNLVIEKYQVVKRLGQGCYGSVFLVKDINSNKHYALKAIKLDTISSNQKFANLEVFALSGVLVDLLSNDSPDDDFF